MLIFRITSKLSVKRKKENELRRKIRRVHSVKLNAVNKPIYVQKVYTVNFGIKYMEAI